MFEMQSPKPILVNDDVRFRTCTCGCHAIYHDRDRGVCRYYEECGCDGMTPEIYSEDDADQAA